MAASEWYYARDGVQSGPVSTAELKQLAESGQVRAQDLVWQDGMKDWVPASKVKGLAFESKAVSGSSAPPAPIVAPPSPGGAAELSAANSDAAPPSVAGAPAGSVPTEVFAAQPGAGQGSAAGAEEETLGPIANLLGSLRAALNASLVLGAADLFTTLGRVALFVTMPATIILGLILSVETKNVGYALGGGGVVIALAVLQHAAGRFVEAVGNLNRVTVGRLASLALPDCFALSCVAGAVGLLAAWSLWAVRSGNYLCVMPGLASCIVGLYATALALNPAALNLAVAADVGAGEEALGVGSFFIKVAARCAPVAFGVGVIWGLVKLIFAGVLVLLANAPGDAATAAAAMAEPEGGKVALAVGMACDGALTTLTAAVLPLLAYFGFLMAQLVLDVLRAILVLPGHIDRMGR